MLGVFEILCFGCLYVYYHFNGGDCWGMKTTEEETETPQTVEVVEWTQADIEAAYWASRSRSSNGQFTKKEASE
jgi:hypothetical protein